MKWHIYDFEFLEIFNKQDKDNHIEVPERYYVDLCIAYILYTYVLSKK